MPPHPAAPHSMVHAGSGVSSNADGGGGVGNADGGGGAGGADGRFAPHGSIGHTNAARMRTRIPGLSGHEGKEPRERGPFVPSPMQPTWNGYYVALNARHSARSRSFQETHPGFCIRNERGLAEIEWSNLPDCDRLGMVLARNATVQQSAWPEQSEAVTRSRLEHGLTD